MQRSAVQCDSMPRHAMIMPCDGLRNAMQCDAMRHETMHFNAERRRFITSICEGVLFFSRLCALLLPPLVPEKKKLSIFSWRLQQYRASRKKPEIRL